MFAITTNRLQTNMSPESKKSLDETLDEIAKGGLRSKIVRLREIFDKVEAAKANGATNKAIVDGLKEHGLIFDVNNFKNARSRILKERAIEALLRGPNNENKSICSTSTPTPNSTATKPKTKTNAPAPPTASAEPRRPITGDDIKNSLRGPVNLKQYD